MYSNHAIISFRGPVCIAMMLLASGVYGSFAVYSLWTAIV